MRLTLAQLNVIADTLSSSLTIRSGKAGLPWKYSEEAREKVLSIIDYWLNENTVTLERDEEPKPKEVNQ